jgi:hypothetical protein
MSENFIINLLDFIQKQAALINYLSMLNIEQGQQLKAVDNEIIELRKDMEKFDKFLSSIFNSL